MSRFYEVHVGKPAGRLFNIVVDLKGLLTFTNISTGKFEFNGKTVIINRDTRLDDCDLVLDKISKGDPNPIVDIRG